MKICQNEKQDTSSEKNSSQTVEIRNKTKERRQCQKQNIFNNKLERSDQKANTNTSSRNENISQSEIRYFFRKEIILKQLNRKDKQMKEKQCQKQNISKIK